MSQAKGNKVVLVAGGLRSLGLEIVKQLAQSSEPLTILASARSPHDLKLPTGNPSTRVLTPKMDVTNGDDISAVAEQVRNLGGLDVLINSAGLSFETFGIEDQAEVMEKTLALRGRIVILSSSTSHDSKFDNAELHKRVTDPKMTREQLDELVKEYSVAGIHPAPGSGWSTSPFGPMYSSVKAFLNILVRIVARDHPDLLINAICPGASYVDPRVQDQMPIKFKRAAQGASEPVRLALGDIDGVTGKYWAGDSLTSHHAHVIDDWMGHEIKVAPRELPDGSLYETDDPQ